MSWIDREVKKRVKATQDPQQPGREQQAATEVGQMAALWDMLQASNNNLPPEIRLQALADPAARTLPGEPLFIAWLQAHNGAGLGFTGDAVRYVWPERGRRASHNFWLRWSPGRGYQLLRRVKSSGAEPRVIESSFDPQRVEAMLKCLVVGTRVNARSVRKRRLWVF